MQSGSASEIQPEVVRNQHGKTFTIAKHNETFESYYGLQKVCDTPEEWQECLSYMRRELPQSLRLNTSRPKQSRAIAECLQKFPLMKPLPWPANNPFPVVWQFEATSRWKLKDCPEISQLRDLLMHERQCGNLSRQELVSMVPVFLLDLQPHHRVLDMCASPGSKSKHALEIMHALAAKDEIPTGFVICNEIDAKRCEKLHTNVMQYASPCSVLVNHDGQHFPDFYTNAERTQSVKYDRIICDVPCSGDGTIRKNPNVWNNWSPVKGNARHHIQFNIAERGAELLDINGIMAYSSCSMNPIENEAVISRLLKISEGSLELIDCSQVLPGFKYAEGFENWRVFSSEMQVFETMQDVPDHLNLTQIHPGMFADTDFNANNNLRLCLRMLPHHSDDGGFFAALIRKVRPLPWEKKERHAEELLAQNGHFYSPRLRKNLKRETFEDPIPRKPKVVKRVKLQNGRVVTNFFIDYKKFEFFQDEDNEELKTLMDFYDLKLNLKHCFKFGQSNIYLCNEAIKNLIQNCEMQNVFFAGIRIFEEETKSRSAVKHKIDHLGKSLIVSMMGPQRTMQVTCTEMLNLIKNEYLNLKTDLSSETLILLERLESLGPLKLYCELPNGDTHECLAFKGQEKLVLQCKRAEKFHGLLVLDEEK